MLTFTSENLFIQSKTTKHLERGALNDRDRESLVQFDPSTPVIVLLTSLVQTAITAVVAVFLLRRRAALTAILLTPIDELLPQIHRGSARKPVVDPVPGTIEEIDEVFRQNGGSGGMSHESLAHSIEINQLKSKLAQAEQQIVEQSRRIELHVAESRVDPLTNLANRRALDEELTRRFSESRRTGHRFCLMLLDIDHFKRLNDTYGHEAGDQALRQVAAVLRATMREMDLIARYGGEEFAVVLPSTELANGRCAAERTRQAFENSSFQIDGGDQRITVSVGLAEAANDETINMLVRRTDAALYAAKAHGRNATFCHEAGELKGVTGSMQRLVDVSDTPTLLGGIADGDDGAGLECAVAT